MNYSINDMIKLALESKNKSKPKDIFNPKNSKLYDPEIISLIDSLSNEFMAGNTPEVYNYIGLAESNNNPLAESNLSNAKGLYQFTPDAVESTKRSAKRNVGYDHDYIDAIPDNPTKWTQSQANVMLTSYLFPKEVKGRPGFVDMLLKKAFKQNPEIEDWEELYKIHHTNLGKTKYLDEITRNMERASKQYR